MKDAVAKNVCCEQILPIMQSIHRLSLLVCEVMLELLVHFLQA
jgi:hypothetical protein